MELTHEDVHWSVGGTASNPSRFIIITFKKMAVKWRGPELGVVILVSWGYVGECCCSCCCCCCCFVLFCFVLFCFVLFCFVLFCFVLFCFVLVGVLLVDQRPSNMLVYLRDGSAQTSLRATTLRQKLQIKRFTLPSHNMLTPGQPVPALTL